METKEIEIVPPEGYEIDKENSTFECIKFKKKLLTYEDIAKELFFHKESLSIDNVDIYRTPDTICYQDKLIAKSSKQLEKLLAINKLLNVSVFLNDGWSPDWEDDSQHKYFFGIEENDIYVNSINTCNESFCYFKYSELAQQAINILGEDTIRLALSTDW